MISPPSTSGSDTHLVLTKRTNSDPLDGHQPKRSRTNPDDNLKEVAKNILESSPDDAFNNGEKLNGRQLLINKRRPTNTDHSLQEIAQDTLNSPPPKRFRYADPKLNKKLFQTYPMLSDRWRVANSIELKIIEDDGQTSIIPTRDTELLKESEYFRTMFSGTTEMIEKIKSTVKVNDHSKDAVTWVIGRLNEQVKLPFVKKFSSSKERFKCPGILKNKISDNADIIDIYKLVHFWQMPKLLDNCRKYLTIISAGNYDDLITIVDLYMKHDDVEGLKMLGTSVALKFCNAHYKKNFQMIQDLHELIEKHNFKMPEEMLYQLRNNIYKVIEHGRITIKELASCNITQIIKDPRIGCDRMKVGTVFYNKLYTKVKKLNIEKIRNKMLPIKEEIILHDLIPLLEEVGIKGYYHNDLDILLIIISSFSQYIKTLFLGPGTEYISSIQKLILDFGSKHSVAFNSIKFPNLEKLHFYSSHDHNRQALFTNHSQEFHYRRMVQSIDLSAYPKLKEIGLVDFEKDCNNRWNITKSLWFPLKLDEGTSSEPVSFVKSFELFLHYFKTQLNQGRLALFLGCKIGNIGNIRDVFQILNMCFKHRLTDINGMKEAMKQSLYHVLKIGELIVCAKKKGRPYCVHYMHSPELTTTHSSDKYVQLSFNQFTALQNAVKLLKMDDKNFPAAVQILLEDLFASSILSAIQYSRSQNLKEKLGSEERLLMYQKLIRSFTSSKKTPMFLDSWILKFNNADEILRILKNEFPNLKKVCMSYTPIPHEKKKIVEDLQRYFSSQGIQLLKVPCNSREKLLEEVKNWAYPN